MDTKTRSKHWQEIAGTRERNLYIYYSCKFHSENGQVKRGIFAKLAREINLTRERIRVIFEMMRLEMEGNDGICS